MLLGRGMSKCFECGSNDNIHQHHVVPRIKGGSKTVPLYERCHGLVHDVSIRSLTAAAIALKKQQRLVYNANPPLGFDAVGGRLVENEREQKIVRMIFAMRRRNLSLHKIAEYCNARRFVGKQGGAFYASTIKNIVDNSIYDAAGAA